MNPELKEFIDEKINYDECFRQILDISTVAWGSKIQKKQIMDWLNNFTGESLGEGEENKEYEHKIALWLLLHFTYFSEKEVKCLCKDLFQLFLKYELEVRNVEKNEEARKQGVKTIRSSTYIAPLGRVGESGSFLMMPFRTVNGLGMNNLEEPSGEIDCLVMLDDVTISGEQAIRYLRDKEIKAKRKYLLVFFATPEAIRFLENSDSGVKVICCSVLDPRTKCFSTDSFAFQGEVGEKIRCLAKQMCTYYGRKIMSNFSVDYMRSYPLGFNNDEQMIGFSYNTPDNTLPIFWCTENWNAIFPRVMKVDDGKVGEHDGQY